jgi:glycosyltransferase involved in cell wall biosynthesis
VRATGPRKIEFLGWRPFQEALELASDCDLGYVSYWFDPGRALEAECCFPSKMISYMGVGLVPFFHGPLNAGPALFLRKFNAGYVCAEQSPEGVLRDLTAALSNPIEHATRGRRCLDVATAEFSPGTFSGRLHKLLQQVGGQKSASDLGSNVDLRMREANVHVRLNSGEGKVGQ